MSMTGYIFIVPQNPNTRHSTIVLLNTSYSVCLASNRGLQNHHATSC
nr:MAG TPA: hypothetical protein [Caudoviricetes sp.]